MTSLHYFFFLNKAPFMFGRWTVICHDETQFYDVSLLWRTPSVKEDLAQNGCLIEIGLW